MNKEWLEEMERMKLHAIEHDDIAMLKIIEQAEQRQALETTVDFYQSALRDADRRVQELEKRLKIYQKRSWFEDYEKVAKQNKRYRATINAMQQILKDAIHSLDVGEKVQGLEYGVQMANEALEGEE